MAKTERCFVDAVTGRVVGVYLDSAEPPAGSVEVPMPRDGRDRYDFTLNRWVSVTPPVEEIRLKEYREKLGSQGDQNDAIYKAWQGAIGLLKEMGATNAQLARHGLLADKDATPGTPAHWLGTIEDIKTRNPKPNQ